MMTKRVQRAIGTLVFLTTCVMTPAQGMESEYRAYEPAGGIHLPSAQAPHGRATPPVVPPEVSRNTVGPVFRTGDGSHAPIVPHVQVDHRPGEIPKPHTGGAGFPIWQW